MNSARGHRLIWAMFNTALLEVSHHMGRAYHKATDSSVLTKRALQELVDKQADLVRECASFGAEIPTTPMFWKRMTTQLEWIVRQMSWWPAWISGGSDALDPMRAVRAAVSTARNTVTAERVKADTLSPGVDRASTGRDAASTASAEPKDEGAVDDAEASSHADDGEDEVAVSDAEPDDDAGASDMETSEGSDKITGCTSKTAPTRRSSLEPCPA